MIINECPNCRSNAWYVHGASVDQPLHRIQCRCARCGLVFSNPQATLGEIESYYVSDYVEGDCAFLEEEFDAARTSSAGWQLDEIQAVVGEGRLLDIGAGVGSFSHAAEERGFEVVGIEPSQRARELAKQRWGLDLLGGLYGDHEFAPRSFDVVYAWHVIEHVPDLRAFLAGIHGVLREGGVLYVGTESYEWAYVRAIRIALMARGRVPPFLTSSAHTMLFSRGSLEDCQRRAGLNVAWVKAYDEVSTDARIHAVQGQGPRSLLRGGLLRAGAAADRGLHWGPYLRSLAVK
jgi:2-polyprenyl-3-methyl-5-hydroxy-6-metoxy-1,4-benzoquinol methylase